MPPTIHTFPRDHNTSMFTKLGPRPSGKFLYSCTRPEVVARCRRLLTCVCPDVSLQVGRFPVNSVASVKSALMSLHRGPRGPHASSSSSSPPQLLLSGDGGGGGGHGRGGRVGQRGVPALPATRGVAAFGVGRHRAEPSVQVGEDTGHRHHVRPFQSQSLPHFSVLIRHVGLPGEQAHRSRRAGQGDRGGSVQDGAARYRYQTLGGKIIR